MKCHRDNSAVMFLNGNVVKCINDYVNNVNKTVCCLKTDLCDIFKDGISDIIFIIGNKCHFNCTYCADNYWRTSLNDCVNNYNKDLVISNLNNIRPSSIHFSYFEPLYNINLFKQILSDIMCCEFITNINISTDGINLNQDLINFLSKIKSKITLSININVPKIIHNKYKGRYEELVRKISMLHKPDNIKIELECVIFKETMDCIDIFINELYKISNCFDSINLVYNHYDIIFYKVNYSIVLLNIKIL